MPRAMYVYYCSKSCVGLYRQITHIPLELVTTHLSVGCMCMVWAPGRVQMVWGGGGGLLSAIINYLYLINRSIPRLRSTGATLTRLVQGHAMTKGRGLQRQWCTRMLSRCVCVCVWCVCGVCVCVVCVCVCVCVCVWCMCVCVVYVCVYVCVCGVCVCVCVHMYSILYASFLFRKMWRSELHGFSILMVPRCICLMVGDYKVGGCGKGEGRWVW